MGLLDVQFSVIDNATPALLAKLEKCDLERVANRVAVPLADFWADHVKTFPPNKQFPGASTGFWERQADSARGVAVTGGVRLSMGEGPALRQRFYGGPITARDKALAIPAREEFYGHGPREFSNLKLVVFRSGSAALVIGGTGIKRTNRAGNTVTVTGAGAKSEALVAYWLVPPGESTRPQAANPNIIPPDLPAKTMELTEEATK